MAQPLQRRRHQEPAQLSRLATRPRSLGRPTRPRSLDQRRHRQRTIPTANAIRALMSTLMASAIGQWDIEADEAEKAKNRRYFGQELRKQVLFFLPPRFVLRSARII